VAAVRLDRLVFGVQDGARAPLPPATYIDVLRVRWNGVVIASVPDPPPTGNIAVDLGGRLLAPGATDSMSVELDLEPTAPTGFLELMLPASGIVAVDANSNQPVAVAPEIGASLPLSSGLARLEPPARTLVADLQSVVSAVLPADGSTVVLARLVLVNTAVPGSGTIAVQSLRFGGGDADFAPQSIGAFASTLEAYRGGVLWASSAPLTVDSSSVSLSAANPLDLDPVAPVTLEIRMVTRPAGAAGSFRVSLDAAGVGVIQPSSALLAITALGMRRNLHETDDFIAARSKSPRRNSLRALMQHPRFVSGNFNTGLIAEEYPKGFHAEDVPHDDPAMLIAVAASILGLRMR